MAENDFKIRIKQKLDTHENWMSNNTVLLSGEIGIENFADGTQKIKIGDGITPWNDLAYFVPKSDEKQVGQAIPNGGEIFNDYENNIALELHSHAEGISTRAIGAGSHAEGVYTSAGSKGFSIYECLNDSETNNICCILNTNEGIDIGLECFIYTSTQNVIYAGVIQSINSESDKYKIITSEKFDTIEEQLNFTDAILIIQSNPELGDVEPFGMYSHAEGAATKAIGHASHTEGFLTIAAGDYSHTEGMSSLASGEVSHAEGFQTISSNCYTHAEGENTTASGEAAHSEGCNTIAEGVGSHAEGYDTKAISDYSHAEGEMTGAGSKGFVLYDCIKEGDDSIVCTTLSKEGLEESQECYIFTGSELINIGFIISINEDSGMFKIVTDNQYKYSITGFVALVVRARPDLGDVGPLGKSTHAEGYQTLSVGDYSHTEGTDTISMGAYSHSEGGSTRSLGEGSHAEGYNTRASGNHSHAEGSDTIAGGHSAHAEGYHTTVQADYGHAEGYHTTATEVAHAEGSFTNALGWYSHAEGKETNAIGHASHTEGLQTMALSANAHAQGFKTQAGGKGFKIIRCSNNNDGTGTYQLSSVEGLVADETMTYNVRLSTAAYNVGVIKGINGTTITVTNYPNIALETDADDLANYNIENYLTITGRPDLGDIDIGFNSFTEGENTIAQDKDTHAEGKDTMAIGQYGHAEGRQTVAAYASHAEGRETKAIGDMSHAEGRNSIASAISAHAEGHYSQAIGTISHAEGSGTKASGYVSHAEGWNSIASGDVSHAEGQKTEASGGNSHAEGYEAKAFGYVSHAEGQSTIASGDISHAEGDHTIASGYASHAEGQETTAQSQCSHSSGHSTYAGTKAYKICEKFENTIPEGQTGNITVKLKTVEGLVKDYACTLRVSNETAIGIYIESIDTENNTVTLRGVPANAKYETDADDLTTHTIENYIVIQDHPELGDIDVGHNAFTSGYNTIAQGREGFATGRDNKVIGQYGFVSGRQNIAAYASHAEGRKNEAIANCSHAEGQGNKASASTAHAEGYSTQATADSAHAEGQNTKASGIRSHAEGWGSTASGDVSHSEGKNTIASGHISHAEGELSEAHGYISHAEGYNTKALSKFSHSEGQGAETGYKAYRFSVLSSDLIYIQRERHADNEAIIRTGEEITDLYNELSQLMSNNTLHYSLISTDNVFASVNTGEILSITNNFSEYEDGAMNEWATIFIKLSNSYDETGYHYISIVEYPEYGDTYIGDASHAEGINTKARGKAAHTEGYNTNALGTASHSEGYNTKATSAYSHTEGQDTYTTGISSHAEGNSTGAEGNFSHAEGRNSIASSEAAHAEGGSTASGWYSHAEGQDTIAAEQHCHSEGYATRANGYASHAEGQRTHANGNYSHSEGESTEANGYTSHAEGRNSIAAGEAAHAEGKSTASGWYSHAEGWETEAKGSYSHAQGKGTIAEGDSQSVRGSYNYPSTNYVDIVGWGTSNSNRKNIYTLDRSGNAIFAGDVKAGEISLSKINTSLGDLLTLETVNKTNIVNAINEVRHEIDQDRIVQSQNTSNIETLGYRIFELSTSINTVSEDTATINLSHNTETRCNTLTNLIITATTPTDMSEQFISSIKFTSGETATVLEYPEEIKMTGEDCIDGKFVPITNKRYNIIFDFDGVYLIGVVGGVGI